MYYGLSVRQPHAERIASGKKSIEWRSRPWKYCGPVVICASARPKIALADGRILPTGAAVCVVDMIGCRPFTRDDLAAACCLDYLEYIYGPPQGYAWLFTNPRRVKTVPVKGKLAPWPWRDGDPEFI